MRFLSDIIILYKCAFQLFLFFEDVLSALHTFNAQLPTEIKSHQIRRTMNEKKNWKFTQISTMITAVIGKRLINLSTLNNDFKQEFKGRLTFNIFFGNNEKNFQDEHHWTLY